MVYKQHVLGILLIPCTDSLSLFFVGKFQACNCEGLNHSAPFSNALPVGQFVDQRGLGFKQSSFYHDVQVLQRFNLSVFGCSPL